MMKPWFYDKFVCTAEKCNDNCCIGWEIDIDQNAMQRFQNVPGEFGERLRGAIHGGEQPVFALDTGDRCALLREDGLCELILNCGEGILCDICALHPRFFNDFGEVEEAGLGLCCEEVCRLLFSRSEPLSFILDDEERAKIAAEDGEIAEFRQAREIMTGILQDRKTGITERLGRCAEYAWRMQERLENGGGMPELPQEWESVPSVTSPECAARLLDTFMGMESVNQDWTSTLERLLQRQGELCAALPQFLERVGEQWRYEHIAVYSLFRHFTDSLSDGAVYGRVMLAVCSALAVMLMDCLVWLDKGSISEWDRILDLKLYSKQVEYSQENIDAFLDEYC